MGVHGSVVHFVGPHRCQNRWPMEWGRLRGAAAGVSHSVTPLVMHAIARITAALRGAVLWGRVVDGSLIALSDAWRGGRIPVISVLHSGCVCTVKCTGCVVGWLLLEQLSSCYTQL